MDIEVLALIGGSFRNGVRLNDVVATGDELGKIIQFGTPTPVTSECNGIVTWIRGNGKVRTDERLYLIAPVVLAAPVVIATLTPVATPVVTATISPVPGDATIAGADLIPSDESEKSESEKSDDEEIMPDDA
jgi:hypothetical protein